MFPRSIAGRRAGLRAPGTRQSLTLSGGDRRGFALDGFEIVVTR